MKNDLLKGCYITNIRSICHYSDSDRSLTVPDRLGFSGTVLLTSLFILRYYSYNLHNFDNT